VQVDECDGHRLPRYVTKVGYNEFYM
jgi:hypothetical protein